MLAGGLPANIAASTNRLEPAASSLALALLNLWSRAAGAILRPQQALDREIGAAT